MLPTRKLWHNATKRTPEREARLLSFAEDQNQKKDDAVVENKDADVTDKDMEAAVNKGTVLPTPEPEKTVKKGTEETKDQVGKLMNDKEKQKMEKEIMTQKFEAIIKKATENSQRLGDLKTRMSDPAVLEKIEKFCPPDQVLRWKSDLKLINREAFNTTKEKDFATALQTFWSGEVAPHDFLVQQEDYMKTLPYGFHDIGAAIGSLTTIQEDQTAYPLTEEEAASQSRPYAATTKDEWFLLNESDRIVTIQRLMQHVQVEDWMSSRMNTYDQMEKYLKQQEDHVDKVEKQIKKIDADAKIEELDADGGFAQMFHAIRWVSINDYLNGVSKYWNAVKSTWETRGDRISAGVARNIGLAMKPFDIFPFYGQEVDTILGQQLDAKDGEEEKGMKETLADNHANWETVFGEGGVFDIWRKKNNPNKLRGILSWAAERGFLYDIDDDLDNHDHPIYGVPVADICSDWAGDDAKISNYFIKLRGDNSHGRDHEKKHGHDMENDIENVPRFIRLVEHEMDEHNLWAAAGIAERAMERGLDGAVAAWLFTTIMSKLREYPTLRRNTPVSFFDIIGKLSMYNTAFTMGWAKRYRRELKQWALSGDPNGAPDESILDKTAMKYFNIIEKDILAKDPSINANSHSGKQRLNEVLARVLAGGIIELPGGHINIFESRFKEYRKMAKDTFASAANPHKEDPDFAIEDTEKTMLPEVTFKEILAYTSTREFKEEKWVMPFLSNLISMEERLGKIPSLRDAHANYCAEISEKMNLHFSSFMKDGQATKQLYTMDTRTGKPALASLVAAGLLSWNVMQNANPEIVKLLTEQLQKFFKPFYMKTVAGGGDKPVALKDTPIAPAKAPEKSTTTGA